MTERDGGCDGGYLATACLWGTEAEPLLLSLSELTDLGGARVYDAGCGEGRNAAFLARRGATVEAVDVSEAALRNAAGAWPDEPDISWRRADLLTERLPEAAYDVVVCDSVVHWLADAAETARLVGNLQQATRPGGFHVLCAFNDRQQDLAGHDKPPRYLPTHDSLVALYAGWTLHEVRDEEIVSAHAGAPHEHLHSVTKVLARRPDGTP